MERDLIRERTVDGLAAAHAQGRRGGRPCALDADTIAIAIAIAAPAANPSPPSPGTSASEDPPSTGHSANLTPPETDPPTHAAYRRMIPTGGLRPWKAASLSARYDTPTESITFHCAKSRNGDPLQQAPLLLGV